MESFSTYLHTVHDSKNGGLVVWIYLFRLEDMTVEAEEGMTLLTLKSIGTRCAGSVARSGRWSSPRPLASPRSHLPGADGIS